MARQREFDINETVEAMSEQFWAEGFEATGITDLEKATGVARASLYAAFGSKQEMLHRSIDHYLDARIERLIGPIDDSGLDGVIGFFQRFAGVVKARPELAARGCLMVNSVVELGTTDPGVTVRAERYRSRIRRAFDSALRVAAETGEIEGQVSERADLAYMMLMGLFVTVRGGAGLGDVSDLCSVAIATVESWRLAPQT